MVRGSWIKPGAVIIDVGINPVEVCRTLWSSASYLITSLSHTHTDLSLYFPPSKICGKKQRKLLKCPRGYSNCSIWSCVCVTGYQKPSRLPFGWRCLLWGGLQDCFSYYSSSWWSRSNDNSNASLKYSHLSKEDPQLPMKFSELLLQGKMPRSQVQFISALAVYIFEMNYIRVARMKSIGGVVPWFINDFDYATTQALVSWEAWDFANMVISLLHLKWKSALAAIIYP